MYFNRRKFLIASGTLLFANSSFSGTLKTPWQSVGPFYPDWEPDDLDNNLVNIGLQGVDAEGIKLDIFGTITNSIFIFNRSLFFIRLIASFAINTVE